MAKKDPDSPATTSLAYDDMKPKWAKIDALLGGTETMRAAGQLYLPQHPEEGGKAFNQRLSTNVLLNMTDMTLTTLVSRPFSAPIKVGDDVPDSIKKLLDDVDLQGTSLDRFARDWFRNGVAKGFSAVLVEFPHVEDNPGGKKRTKADDLKEKLRPYLVKLAPENIIAASREIVNGKEVLTEVRIWEEVTVKNKYAETIVNRIRVLTVGKGEVFELKKRSGKDVWVSIEEYSYDLNFIPVVIFYADRQDFMRSKPPLTDLCDLNIRHWQSSSDQNAVLTVARFPMLAVSGAVDDDTVVVGPNRLLSVTDPTGRFYYVEHTGKAISVGRQDLLDLEEQMAEYGATFLKKRPGNATATSRALDSAEVTSALQDMALGFQDSLNQAMYMMAVWLGENIGGLFSVKTDFSLTDNDTRALENLTAARKNRDISRTYYLQALMRYGVLPDNFPVDANEKELAAEQVQITADAAALAKATAVEKPAAPAPAA